MIYFTTPDPQQLFNNQLIQAQKNDERAPLRAYVKLKKQYSKEQINMKTKLIPTE